MKKNIAKRCEVCNTKEVKFVQNGLGYCGISSVLGSMNIFGIISFDSNWGIISLVRLF